MVRVRALGRKGDFCGVLIRYEPTKALRIGLNSIRGTRFNLRKLD